MAKLDLHQTSTGIATCPKCGWSGQIDVQIVPRQPFNERGRLCGWPPFRELLEVRIWCALHQDSKSCQSLRYVFRVAGALALGGHPQPAIEGHLKTGQSDKSQVDVDARQKTPGVVASLTPDVSCHRASPKVAGHKHEIVREQVKSLETTKAGKNHQVFGQSRWLVFE